VLIYAELIKLRTICLWCTFVHIVCLLLFVVTGFGTAATWTTADTEPSS
jgi:uncharacterized membrane protein